MKKIFFLLILLPALSRAQHPTLPAGNKLQTGQAMFPEKMMHPSSDAKLRQTVWRIIGSRRDTFDIATATFGASDSSYYDYNSDTLLNTYNQLKNDPDSGWISYIASFYGYDAMKNNISQLIQQWDNDSLIWINLSQLLNGFDANGNLIYQVQEVWNNNEWDSSLQIINTYDASSNLLSQTYVQWNIGYMDWDTTNQFIYTYDSNNNVLTETDLYNGVNSFLQTYQYNSANLDTVRIGQYWNGSTWKNSWADTFTYDANNNNVLFVRWNWNQPDHLFDHTEAKFLFEYDASNKLTYREDFNGDGGTSFIPAADYTYTNDANGNRIYALLRSYDAGNMSFTNQEQDFYYYTDIFSGIAPGIPDNALHFRLYPNPGDEQLNLTCELFHSASVQLEVISVDGIVLSSNNYSLKAGTNSITLNSGSFAPGIYLLRITDTKSKAQWSDRFMKQ